MIELTEAFLAKIAGWEAMKQARSLLQAGHVLSSNWTPPLLKGVVQEGSTSYRAGLVLKDSIDLENICSCRASRQWGTICAHSVAVGLHHLRRNQPVQAEALVSAQPGRTAAPVAASAKPGLRKSLRRAEADSGEPLSIWAIFPPNLAQAMGKGKVMVCFEGEWRQGRAPLPSLPGSVPFRLNNEDKRLLDCIEEIAEGETPAMLMLGPSELGRLFSAAAGHPRFTMGRKQTLRIASEPKRLQVRARLESSGEIRLSLLNAPAAIALGEALWTFDGSELRRVSLGSGLGDLLKGPVVIGRQQVPQFLSTQWASVQAQCDVEANFTLDDFVLEPAKPQFNLMLAGGLAQLQAQLQCVYGQRIVTVGMSSESFWLPDPDAPTRYATRDVAAERAALERLLRHGFSGPDVRGMYQLTGQNAVLNFFAREYPKLEREWQVTLEARLERSTAQHLERIEPRFEITPSGEQWFDLSVAYTTAAGDRFSAAEIQRLLLSGQSYARLKNGKMAVIDTGAVEELQEVILDCAPQQHEGRYRVDHRQAGYLESAFRQHSEWQVQASPEWRRRAAQQSGLIQLKAPDLGSLENVLRPYQKDGVAWMRFLRENRFGGILADEMGLGKTLQTLAFISVIVRERQSAGSALPVLVVCPSGLVFNWVAETRKFTPELKVLALRGQERHEQFARVGESDLVITSYALIRRDAERYRGLEFDTIVLDEAQHIKNRQTQNAQAVKAIRSRHRLVLTGTPLENSVLDLWSIFDFLMPGYLGTAREFRERYELPIVREKDPGVQGRLARRVRPFLLRRLKSDVARELPEKIEQVSFCELTEDQRAVYQEVLEAGRRAALESTAAEGQGKNRMLVLNALLRLRQICCDLRLLQLERVNPESASGKLEVFEELLQEALDGGHRVLVFSQFVTMLHLIRERLAESGIEYCYLDGATHNRAEVVERFEKTPSVPVFLISLKAGGVGLNLASADTVIHFDPWWNPAVEAQATDRAHRIGQTRIVTSYKLITRGTVEEKIYNLQERKRSVIQRVLAGEDEFTEALTWEEIQELLH